MGSEAGTTGFQNTVRSRPTFSLCNVSQTGISISFSNADMHTRQNSCCVVGLASFTAASTTCHSKAEQSSN